MAGPQGTTLVIGVASSALFDLTESDRVFREEKEHAYRHYQEENYDVPLQAGVAYPFLRRLLALNDLSDPDDPLVEIVILSRNSPETGARVMRSAELHDLAITRAVFTQGRPPYPYMDAFGMTLFLSANHADVAAALGAGYPAGTVLGSAASLPDDPTDRDLRIAFDFDGVLGDDSSEQVFDKEGIDAFRRNEVALEGIPLPPGPMKGLLHALNRIQDREDLRVQSEPAYRRRLFVSLVTARSAPTHRRAIHTLRSWGLQVNDGFFLGGWEKGAVLQILRPHIFFDDQLTHLEGTRDLVPSVHVPFGIKNIDTSQQTPR